MNPSATAGHGLRLLRRGGGLALAVAFLTATLATPGRAQEDPRAKSIREVEQKIAELNAKLAALKAIDPTKGRQPLRLSDVLAWRSISGATLSRDGKWFACAIIPGEGKGEVFARQTGSDKEYRFKDVERVGDLSFSHDGRWLAFSTTPRRRGPAMVGPLTPAQESGKVILVNLTAGDKVEYEGVTRFQFSGPESNVLAIHRSPATPAPSGPTAPGTTATPPASRSRGSDLILRDLAAGKDLTLGNVAEFSFDKKGTRLAVLIDAQGRFGNGVQLRDMKTAALQQLETGKAAYEGLRWTESGDAFSLLKGEDQEGKTEKKYTILTCTNLASPTLAAVDPAKAAGFPKELVVSAGHAPTFSDDRATLFFSIAEPGKGTTPEGRTKGKGKGKDEVKGPALETTAKGGAEKPDLVIWHWNDSRLQSEQQKSESMDRGIRYLCAYHLKDGKFVRLADDTVRNVSVAPKERYAIGVESRPYERLGSLDGKRLVDVHVIDVRTGERHVALKAARNYRGASPDGNKFLYYEDGQFLVYDIPTKKSRVITKDVPTSLIDTEDDHPIDRPPTRSMGWTKDSSAVLLSDNWDVWKVPVAEGVAVNLTQNGKKDGIRYQTRAVLDPEEKGADLTQPQIFAMYGEWTKKSGYLRLDPKAGPTVLCWEDAAFGVSDSFPVGLAKVREAEVYLYPRGTVTQYPDYYSCDATFKSPRRLTTANPDQDRFKFCSGSMLVNYESAKGDKLQGALFLPADYEKGKKYPTVVYIYERLSDKLNHYLMPRLPRGGFNPSLYTSNGYAVFMPDIRYKLNDPGMSAVWCVMPALEAAIATGVVDRDRVGLHGHSWGGYQTAFLITQTPAFKAAVAGAPLTDLISMYSSIYWNVGIANQPIFESSQGRFTSGYWDQPEAYIRNSPVFHAKKVVTPLILLHNDKDGAVDFNQGIEYFNTLRRLDKPVVMLQYKGENHGLAKEANMKDYTVRMREFFDHHLQGKPAPAWLKEGVPHLKMEEHLKTRTFKE